MDEENGWVASINEEMAKTPPIPDPAPAPAPAPAPTPDSPIDIRIDAPPKLGHVGGGVTRHDGRSIKKVRIGLHNYREWRGEDMYTVKRKFLLSLLRRRQEKSLEEYATAMREMVEPALKCYQGPTDFDGSPNREEFAEMMLLDSCFVVELLRNMAEPKEGTRKTKKEVADDHPFCNLVHDLKDVKHDLICIENQLPIFVLEEFFEMSKHPTDPHNLNVLVKKFSEEMLSEFIPSSKGGIFKSILKFMTYDYTAHHQKNDHPTGNNSLLGEMYSILLKNSDYHRVQRMGWSIGERDFIKCATELEEEAGIGFKEAFTNILNIDFEHGEMLIPPFKFTSSTVHILSNLIEYEKQYPSDFPRVINEYVKFMQCLLHSEKDVQVLSRGRIIANWTGNNERVSSSFNYLGNQAEISNDYSLYEYVIWKVNNYCGRRRNRWMAKLWRNYFNSPWSFISFLAALFLLLLTVTQTVFAILAYTQQFALK